MKPEITIDEFDEIHKKLEIRIGKIIAAEAIPKSNGLKLFVAFDKDENDIRTAFTNLGKFFKPEQLLDLKAPFIMNLTPSVIKGVNSEIMIMAAEDSEGKIDLGFSIGTKLM
jgi:methionyl-tRNA synthetase